MDRHDNFDASNARDHAAGRQSGNEESHRSRCPHVSRHAPTIGTPV